MDPRADLDAVAKGKYPTVAPAGYRTPVYPLCVWGAESSFIYTEFLIGFYAILKP